MPVMFLDGEILFVGGQIAFSSDCCCGEPGDYGPCCEDLVGGCSYTTAPISGAVIVDEFGESWTQSGPSFWSDFTSPIPNGDTCGILVFWPVATTGYGGYPQPGDTQPYAQWQPGSPSHRTDSGTVTGPNGNPIFASTLAGPADPNTDCAGGTITFSGPRGWGGSFQLDSQSCPDP